MGYKQLFAALVDGIVDDAELDEYIADEVQKCPICKETLPLSGFFNFIDAPYACKSCVYRELRVLIKNQPKVIAKIIKKWDDKHPEYKRTTILEHTDDEWEEKKASFRYRCAYCGVSDKLLTKDHVVPRAKGGGDGIENIVPSCMRCNLKKHTRDLIDFPFEPMQLNLGESE